MQIGGHVGHTIPHWIASALEAIFHYTGDLSVDDVVEIDSNTLLVTLNGNNARPNFNGDFPELKRGETKLQFFDDETDRTVEVEIIKEDRHI